MSTYRFLLLLPFLLLISCSSGGESDDLVEPDLSLAGMWALTGAEFDDPGSLDAIFAQQVFAELNSQGCVLVGFTFEENGTGSAVSRIEYLDISGFQISCPQESDTETFDWSQEGDQLTITDDLGESSTVTINLQQDSFRISGDEVDPDSFGGAVAVFTRL